MKRSKKTRLKNPYLYSHQRNNHDIISPVTETVRAIKGHLPHSKTSAGGPGFVDEYDRAVVRVGENKQYKGSLNLNNGGPESLDRLDRTIGKLKSKDPKKKPKQMKPKNRMHCTERLVSKPSDYYTSRDAQSLSKMRKKCSHPYRKIN